jgi:hypothetical protein
MTFQFQNHQAFYTFDGRLSIGCISMSITEWSLSFKEIGAEEDYNQEQIEMYGNFIQMCLQHFNSRKAIPEVK